MRLLILLSLLFFAEAHIKLSKLMDGLRMKRQAATDVATLCATCEQIIGQGLSMVAANTPDAAITENIMNLCAFAGTDEVLCQNIASAFLPEILYVVRRSNFTALQLCGTVITPCAPANSPRNTMWTIPLPANKPPVKPYKVQHYPRSLKVLQLTDVHIDWDYKEGSEAMCGSESVVGAFAQCCRSASSASGGSLKLAAGKWGTTASNCDLPYNTFVSALKYIKSTLYPFDYVLLTGDFEAHDPWDYTRNRSISTMTNVTKTIKQYFPGVPVYVALGNHEGVPQDAFAPESIDGYKVLGPQWLYKGLQDVMSNFIPGSLISSALRHGSYVIKAAPGFHLIMLNNNYCSQFNYYGYLNLTDPGGVLGWLVEQLVIAEAHGCKAHIVTHIPPGIRYCLPGWSKMYFEIAKRFENTITEHISGHTHYDSFQVYYDGSRPFTSNWISPSLTTFGDVHPAFRIYTIDGGYTGATYHIREAETYWANLTEANLRGVEPQWKFEYNHKDAYGVSDFSPSSLDQLAKRIEINATLQAEFFTYYFRGAQPGCISDPVCRNGNLCSLSKTDQITTCPAG